MKWNVKFAKLLWMKFVKPIFAAVINGDNFAITMSTTLLSGLSSRRFNIFLMLAEKIK